MAPCAFHRDASAGRCRNFGHYSERNLVALQRRPLFDVQLDECLVVVAGAISTSPNSPRNPAFRRTSSTGSSSLSFSFFSSFRRERAGEQTAAKASDSKARRLFGRENQQFD